jgi:hypothetical protein
MVDVGANIGAFMFHAAAAGARVAAFEGGKLGGSNRRHKQWYGAHGSVVTRQLSCCYVACCCTVRGRNAATWGKSMPPPITARCSACAG